MAEAGVDAVIVQDIGVVRLMRSVAPSLPAHGSTQMSVTSAEGAEFARRLGCDRVVAGRELSVRELAAVRRGCDAELEAFCHGALCVSYSGQCFSSEAWGGRSANRGQCAQACRMPYGLVVDGLLKDLGDIQYLLSPQARRTSLHSTPAGAPARHLLPPSPGVGHLCSDGRYGSLPRASFCTCAGPLGPRAHSRAHRRWGVLPQDRRTAQGARRTPRRCRWKLALLNSSSAGAWTDDTRSECRRRGPSTSQ